MFKDFKNIFNYKCINDATVIFFVSWQQYPWCCGKWGAENAGRSVDGELWRRKLIFRVVLLLNSKRCATKRHGEKSHRKEVSLLFLLVSTMSRHWNWHRNYISFKNLFYSTKIYTEFLRKLALLLIIVSVIMTVVKLNSVNVMKKTSVIIFEFYFLFLSQQL